MIAVITYDHEHRKTEDVIWRLLVSGHCEIEVLATPWVERKERHYLYGHRPAEKHWPCWPSEHPRDYCFRMNIPYHAMEKVDLLDAITSLDPAAVVIGGAGILPRPLVTDIEIINIHPGLLPARRGLDVLKWSVVHCRKVGVTAHICDQETDLGWRLLEREVPVYPEDSFFSFAMRQYETELSTVAPAVQMMINQPDRNGYDRIVPGETKPFKRMPLEIEATLPEAFERYKRVFAE